MLSFQTLNDAQFKLSTQLIVPNYPVILSPRRSTIVSLETTPYLQLLHGTPMGLLWFNFILGSNFILFCFWVL